MDYTLNGQKTAESIEMLKFTMSRIRNQIETD
jgi:hypothetical protein